MTTVSSGRMTTQAFTSGGLSAARATAVPNGIRKPSERPPPAAAALARNVRRLTCDVVVMVMARPLCLGRHVDRLANLLVSAAAADVRDSPVDIGIARLRVFLQ